MKKKILIGILCLVLCLPCVWVIAKVVHIIRYTDGDYIFVVLEDGTAEIRQYTGRETNVIIPPKMRRYEVSRIADKAFEYRFWMKEVTLPDGRKEWYAFGADGIGLTGEVNGYLYYKGRLQTGTGIRAVTVVKNEGSDLADVTNRYLVDASGKILKNAENVQGEGGTFSSNAAGIATAVNGTSERAQGPAEADFTAYIGDNEKD